MPDDNSFTAEFAENAERNYLSCGNSKAGECGRQNRHLCCQRPADDVPRTKKQKNFSAFSATSAVNQSGEYDEAGHYVLHLSG